MLGTEGAKKTEGQLKLWEKGKKGKGESEKVN